MGDVIAPFGEAIADAYGPASYSGPARFACVRVLPRFHGRLVKNLKAWSLASNARSGPWTGSHGASCGFNGWCNHRWRKWSVR